MLFLTNHISRETEGWCAAQLPAPAAAHLSPATRGLTGDLTVKKMTGKFVSVSRSEGWLPGHTLESWSSLISRWKILWEIFTVICQSVRKMMAKSLPSVCLLAQRVVVQWWCWGQDQEVCIIFSAEIFILDPNILSSYIFAYYIAYSSSIYISVYENQILFHISICYSSA